MPKSSPDRPLCQRIAIDVAGFSLMIISPFLGWLPGPGGIPLFLAGLGLVSLNHEWAARLLKDFERRREEMTDKYLMVSPGVSKLIDGFSIFFIALGLYVAATEQQIVLKGLGLAAISISMIIILSNQKRFERFTKWLKKHKP